MGRLLGRLLHLLAFGWCRSNPNTSNILILKENTVNKTVIALAIGMVVGFAAANLINSETVMADADPTNQVESNPIESENGNLVDFGGLDSLLQEQASSCSDGETCRKDSDCGDCYGYPCKCRIPTVGTCACP